jgi:hypothetical protein
MANLEEQVETEFAEFGALTAEQQALVNAFAKWCGKGKFRYQIKLQGTMKVAQAMEMVQTLTLPNLMTLGTLMKKLWRRGLRISALTLTTKRELRIR